MHAHTLTQTHTHTHTHKRSFCLSLSLYLSLSLSVSFSLSLSCTHAHKHTHTQTHTHTGSIFRKQGARPCSILPRASSPTLHHHYHPLRTLIPLTCAHVLLSYHVHLSKYTHDPPLAPLSLAFTYNTTLPSPPLGKRERKLSPGRVRRRQLSAASI